MNTKINEIVKYCNDLGDNQGARILEAILNIMKKHQEYGEEWGDRAIEAFEAHVFLLNAVDEAEQMLLSEGCHGGYGYRKALDVMLKAQSHVKDKIDKLFLENAQCLAEYRDSLREEKLMQGSPEELENYSRFLKTNAWIYNNKDKGTSTSVPIGHGVESRVSNLCLQIN